MEKLRRRPPSSSTSRYCPGWNRNVSTAGNLSSTCMTSGASGVRRAVRHGSVLISTSATLAMSRASTTRSDSARAWQSRMWPVRSSSAVMPAGRPLGYRISPARRSARHELQWPDLQLCGRLSPAASAASSTGWPARTWIVRSCGRMRTVYSLALKAAEPGAGCKLRAYGLSGQGSSVFTNPSTEEITQLLRSAHTIAVVGLSADPTRPSHGVARALQRFGYRIIPVTPAAEVVLGEPAVPSLDQLPEVLGGGERVDIVDVFRRPAHVAGI